MSMLRLAVGLMFSAMVWGQVSGTVTLTSGMRVDLGTGVVSAAGGHLLFQGGNVSAVGDTNLADLTILLGQTGTSLSGATAFAQLTLSQMEQDANRFQLLTRSYGAGAPPAGEILLVSIGGESSLSKVLVTANSTTSITLQYVTYTLSVVASSPIPTAIQNNYSYIQQGMPNYGIAPGALFILKGDGLADAGPAVVQSSESPGLPLTLNGASVAVTVNGVTTHPALYYATPTQLAAVLPSSTPVGFATVTLTYNGHSGSPAGFQVVASAVGLDTVDGSGSGLGVATDASTGALIGYTASASPGQTIVLWGSGLGANPSDSDTTFTSTPHAINVPLTVYIGGVQATVLYQGGSGYPGLNQINVVIPPSVATGCAVSVVAIAGVTSNTVTLPIQVGGGTCNDPALGADGDELNALRGTAVYNLGQLTISETPALDQGGATASFLRQPGNQSSIAGTLVSLGNCIVSPISQSPSSPPSPGLLDAGAISLTGFGPSQTLTGGPGVSGAEIYNLGPGPWTLAGTGGKDVGAFTATLSLPSAFAWTNMNSISTVNRSQGLTATWTGAAPNSYVTISGSTFGPNPMSGFTCRTPASAGQFTVPSWVLSGLATGNQNTFTVENDTFPQTFSASGLDYTILRGSVSFSINPLLQ